MDQAGAHSSQPKRRWFSRKAPPVMESRCGKCSYLVTGLPTFACPECGSDLREVGIVKQESPVKKRRFGVMDLPRATRLRLARAFIFLGAVIALGISVVFFNFTPMWMTEHYVNSFSPKTPTFSRLELGTDFRTLRLNGTYYDEHQKNVNVVVTIIGADGSSHSMHVDLPSLKMAYDITRGSTWTWTTVFDEAELLKWMKDEAGLDTSNSAIKKEAGELVKLFKEYHTMPPVSWKEFMTTAQTDLASFDSRGFTGSMGFHAGSILAVGVVAAILYALIVFRMLRAAVAKGKAEMIAQGRWEEPEPQTPPPSRTLTVLFVDLKDFTGQAATLSRARLLALLRRQRDIVEKAVTPQGGKIVKTMGDGIIVTFESATNAVLAGLAIQAGARKCGIELRVGITTGEVTIEENDVYGPAVNVAARLQAAASAGDVYFSEATRHSINTAEISAEDLGMMELKGVPERVRVYCARELRGQCAV